MSDDTPLHRNDRETVALPPGLRPPWPRDHPPSTVQQLRLTPGTILGRRYRIVSPLGRGGMGEVYRADDLRLGQPVALKFLPESLAADRARLDLLYAEVRVGRQVSHPNVCRLYDVAETEGRHFIVMEYVDGEDLASLLRRIGRLPYDKALDVARGLGAGLAAVHDKGIVHRDLKPANVLIDARGQARLSDFGLAISANEGTGGGAAGTPAYMAPEQLAGEGATVRSDLYALGLVLYEMLAGKRPFEGRSSEDLRAGHAEDTPRSLRSSIPEVDPAVERIVLQCLERDPAARPPSAPAVLAALPGGDPLQAAIAAGQTPSPEMVAASSEVGDLRPAAAWALLLATLAGLWFAARSADQTALFRRLGLPKPPAVLAERAREILRGIGCREPPFDAAQGFIAAETSGPQGPAREMRDVHLWPGPLRFFYRQSPERLQPGLPAPGGLWTPGVSPWGLVTRDDPPLNEPGEADVVVDPEGRLVELRAVPPGAWEPEREVGAVVWSTLFAAAGLDPAAFREVPPRWTPPVVSQGRRAWESAEAGLLENPLYIEGAAFGARPVWFRVIGPFVPPPEPPRPAGAVQADRSHLAVAVWVVLLAALFLGSFVLARRNLRQGRGDQLGAWRLALGAFAMLSAGYLLRMHHHALVAADWMHVLTALMLSGAWALAAWAAYVGIEPHVRRFWPRALVSWARLLSGRFRDPMVGRDVLVGVFLALAIRVLGAFLAPSVTAPFSTFSLEALGSLHRAVALSLSLAYSAVGIALGGLLCAVILRTVLGSGSRALLVIWLVGSIPGLAGQLWVGGARAILSALGLYWLMWAGLMATALVRFGLLSTAVALYVFLLWEHLPIALDFAVWYSGQTAFGPALVAALAIGGFFTSLGGKPLFGRAFFPD